ncbi:hypothetical protein [Methylomonas sp. AM2-LC]|uniref:hypothetical protein n=1 Tax=Methylomonas sp. AM2-LC TaxID=3153301 RepID=UPI00326619BA
MDYQSWCESFKPIENKLNVDEPMFVDVDNGRELGILFRNEGEDIVYVNEIAKIYNDKIWTVAEFDGRICLSSGFKSEHAIAYAITEIGLSEKGFSSQIIDIESKFNDEVEILHYGPYIPTLCNLLKNGHFD